MGTLRKSLGAEWEETVRQVEACLAHPGKFTDGELAYLRQQLNVTRKFRADTMVSQKQRDSLARYVKRLDGGGQGRT